MRASRIPPTVPGTGSTGGKDAGIDDHGRMTRTARVKDDRSAPLPVSRPLPLSTLSHEPSSNASPAGKRMFPLKRHNSPAPVAAASPAEPPGMMAVRRHRHAGRRMPGQLFGLIGPALGIWPGMPGRTGTGADFHHRGQARLREGRGAAPGRPKVSRARTPPRSIRTHPSRATRRQGYRPGPAVPCTGHEGPGTAPRPNRQLRRDPPHPAFRAAQDLAGLHLPEPRHHDHATDHDIGRQMASPAALVR